MNGEPYPTRSSAIADALPRALIKITLIPARSGLFVRLLETGADGFVPASSLGQDYYRYVEEQQAMIGDRTGERFRLGDTVTVRLLEAAPVAGALRFELISDGPRVKAPSSNRGAKRPYRAYASKGRRR